MEVESCYLVILGLSLITSGVLTVRRRQAGPEEGFSGQSLIKGEGAVLTGFITIVFGVIVLAGGLGMAFKKYW